MSELIDYMITMYKNIIKHYKLNVTNIYNLIL